MAQTEFEKLLNQYLPPTVQAKDIETEDLICGKKGICPSSRKIKEYCISKVHCTHLIPKQRFKEGDEKFFKQ